MFESLCCDRVLFEVASLERSEDTVQEACLRHLAASVRAAHKIHGFAGGFDAELSSLFDKVRCRLLQYEYSTAVSVVIHQHYHSCCTGHNTRLDVLQVRRLANYYVRILEPPSNTN